LPCRTALSFQRQTREIAQAQESEKALVGKISAAKANLERDQEELKAADLQIVSHKQRV
jgi:hypothetical protein